MTSSRPFLVAALLSALPLLGQDTTPFPPQPPVQAVSPQEAAKTFQLPPGYHMELVLERAGDRGAGDHCLRWRWPHVRGRDALLHAGDRRQKRTDAPISRVSLHWSSKNDGHYDKHTVFADKLVLPRMILPLDERRVVIGETNTNDLYLYTDTKGSGVADKKELWFARRPARRQSRAPAERPALVASITGCYSTYNAYRLRWTPQGVVKEPTGA